MDFVLRRTFPLRDLIDRLLSRVTNRAVSRIYRARLSEQDFATYLARNDAPGDRFAQVEGERPLADVMYAGALEFRNRIGPRFFVSPATVDRLCQESYLSHPAWRGLLAAEVADAFDSGLIVYGTRGPRLRGDFPWASLPPGPGGDILYPYRPHRFAFLPRLALAAYQGTIPPRRILDLVDGWISQAASGRNPFCYGTNLVVIQRILATVWSWTFLAARSPANTPEGLGLESRLLRVLWADVQFLEPRLGESVANNHLLVDRFAGWFLTAVFPEFLSCGDESAEQRFRDELLRQTNDDGGGFEHSIHYHEFACEMGAAYLLLCHRLGRAADQLIRTRVAAMLRFQSLLAGAEAVQLHIGNATEDPLFPLDSVGGACPGALREIYRALFSADLAPAPSSDLSIERAFWLLGGNLQPAVAEGDGGAGRASFPVSGFEMYPDEVTGGRLVFRTGPGIGAPVVGGHMHADLLSVYLSLNGQPMLVDAGTYTYRGVAQPWPRTAPAWRTYLAGAAAHNTFVIEDHDPLGPLEGDFRRFDVPARVRHGECSGSDLCWSEATMLHAGAYSGYTRGCVFVPGCYWVIYDHPPLTQAGSQQKRWCGFQFAPGVRLETRGAMTMAELRDGQRRCALVTSLQDVPELLEGSVAPVGGWFSPRYGELLPAPQLRYPVAPSVRQSVFVITTRVEMIPVGVDVDLLVSGALSIRVSFGAIEDVLTVRGERCSPRADEAEDDGAIGRALWVRMHAGVVASRRQLYCQSH